MAHRTFSVTLLGDLCFWKAKRGYWAILLRIYGARKRNHGLHGVVRSEGAEVRNHLADEITCKERSRVLGKLEEVNERWEQQWFREEISGYQSSRQGTNIFSSKEA